MSLMFSKHAVDALNAASSCARQFGHDHIGAEHIFLSLLAIPACQAAQRLVALGLELDDLAESMKTMIAGNSDGLMQRGQLPLTARTKKIIDMAGVEAGQGKVVDTVHLVIAMLREGENAAAQLLFNAGVNVEKFIAAGAAGGVKGEGEGEAEGDGENSEPTSTAQTGANGKAQKTPTVNSYGRDLTALARQG